MMNRSSIQVFVTVVLLLALTGCSKKAGPEVEEKHSAAVAQVAKVELRTISRYQPVIGTARPLDRASVGSKLMGEAVRADFALGQTVARGEILVVLSADEASARLEQAQAIYDQLSGDLKRESSLLERGATTAESARALADRLRGAEAAVAEARSMLGYAQIRAPFDGVITRKDVHRGDMVVPGSPLFQIEETDRLRAEIEVPASLPMLELGDRVKVEYEGGEAWVKLDEYSPAADARSRTRLAKLSFEEGHSARSGDFVRAYWPAGNYQAVLAPVDSLRIFGQMEQMFVVEDGRARMRLVKTSGQVDGQFIVSAGLNAGDVIVLHPPARLRDGQALEIAR